MSVWKYLCIERGSRWAYLTHLLTYIPESLHLTVCVLLMIPYLAALKYTNFPTATSTNRLMVYPVHAPAEEAAIREKNLCDYFEVT